MTRIAEKTGPGAHHLYRKLKALGFAGRRQEGGCGRNGLTAHGRAPRLPAT